MKKYVHVYDNEIVYKYQNDKPVIFGGPWAEGLSIEVPEGMDYLTVQIEINDGEITVVEG